jgi:hypothetical protein
MSDIADCSAVAESFMLEDSAAQAAVTDWLDESDVAGADDVAADVAGADVEVVPAEQPASRTRPATAAVMVRTGMGMGFS